MSAAVTYTLPEPLGSQLAGLAMQTGVSLERWIEWACWERYQWYQEARAALGEEA